MPLPDADRLAEILENIGLDEPGKRDTEDGLAFLGLGREGMSKMC
jgi:hypothetical protein